MMWGKQKRLDALKKDGDYYLILALDHSLSYGPIEGIASISDINSRVQDAIDFSIPSVVLNAGIIDKLDVIYDNNIIVQMMGLPNIAKGNFNKVKIATIERAISLGATAISVQLNLKSEDLNQAVSNVSTIVNEANKYGLPVMFMLNHADYDSISEFSYSIRICVELGADIIKTKLPSKKDIKNKIEPFSKQHPPVVLAGGSPTNGFLQELKTSKSLGFRGACIGRNIFQSPEPRNIVELIDQEFKAK